MTEKNYNPKQKEKKSMAKAQSAEKQKIVEKTKKIESTKIEEKKEKKQDEKETIKKQEKKEIRKREFAIVNSYSIPISTKKAAAICRFIKGKTIDETEEYLKKVIQRKKAIPIRGEIAHRKGKIMSGIFPKKAAEEFLILLKSLTGNSNVNGINEPVISEAVANLAQRPYARFGRWRKKRTHIMLKAVEKKNGREKNS